MSSFDSKIGVNWLIRPSRHRGVDFPAPVGTPVIAAMEGVVSKVYLNPKVGWIVRIHHPQQNWDTRYLHLRESLVKVGDSVHRGQRIGSVGLFEFSAGVEHVHLELYDMPRPNYKQVRDPMAVMAGCLDRSTSYEQDQLTLPLDCSPSWLNRTRPVESKWTAADLQIEVGVGALSAYGVRTRGIVPSAIGTKRLKVFTGWDLAVGALAEGDLSYEARLLSGIGFAHGLFDMGVLGGVGLSEAGPLERGFSLPTTVFWRIKQRKFWGRFWARSSWLYGSQTRQNGASLSVLRLDEIALGAQVRIPPLTLNALTFSLEYREFLNDSQFLFGVGFSFDTLKRD